MKGWAPCRITHLQIYEVKFTVLDMKHLWEKEETSQFKKAGKFFMANLLCIQSQV